MILSNRNVDVQIFDEQKDLIIAPATVKAVVSEILSFQGKWCDEVSIHFVTTETICELHRRFFDDPSPTDCISLPLDSADEEGFCILGEVFICPATAQDYAKKHHKDPFDEVTLYLIHAILHLLGYEDQGDAEPEMRAAEVRHVSNLTNKNLSLKPFL